MFNLQSGKKWNLTFIKQKIRVFTVEATGNNFTSGPTYSLDLKYWIILETYVFQ